MNVKVIYHGMDTSLLDTMEFYGLDWVNFLKMLIISCNQKLYSIKGKLEMLELFCYFIDKVKNLDVMLETYYKKNLISLGLSEKIIYDISTKMIDNEVSRDLNL